MSGPADDRTAFRSRGSAEKRPTSPVESRERDVRRLDALQGLLERVVGKSLTEAAAIYTPTLLPPTSEPLTDPQKDAIRDELERLCFERLAPLVLAVYEAQLRLGNLDAARDMGLSLGILKRPPTATKIIAAPAPRPVNTLEEYRLERQSRTYRAGDDPRPRTRLITPGSDTPT